MVGRPAAVLYSISLYLVQGVFSHLYQPWISGHFHDRKASVLTVWLAFVARGGLEEVTLAQPM